MPKKKRVNVYLSKRAKPKRDRGPNRLYETEAGKLIYKMFVRKFIDHFTLNEAQTIFSHGVPSFFGVAQRSIVWYRSKERFTLPGSMWSRPESPYHLVDGTGRRLVIEGQALIIRTDERTPDRNEVELDEQVFVLTEAQLNFVLEKLEVIA